MEDVVWELSERQWNIYKHGHIPYSSPLCTLQHTTSPWHCNAWIKHCSHLSTLVTASRWGTIGRASESARNHKGTNAEACVNDDWEDTTLSAHSAMEVHWVAAETQQIRGWKLLGGRMGAEFARIGWVGYSSTITTRLTSELLQNIFSEMKDHIEGNHISLSYFPSVHFISRLAMWWRSNGGKKRWPSLRE